MDIPFWELERKDGPITRFYAALLDRETKNTKYLDEHYYPENRRSNQRHVNHVSGRVVIRTKPGDNVTADIMESDKTWKIIPAPNKLPRFREFTDTRLDMVSHMFGSYRLNSGLKTMFSRSA
jgi:hypothetical protein